MKKFCITKTKIVTTTDTWEVGATDECAARMAVYSMQGIWGTLQRPGDGYGFVTSERNAGPVTESRTTAQEVVA